MLTEEVFSLASPTHKSSDFTRFLRMLDKKYLLGDKIRLIPDNHSAYTSKETQKYLNTVSGRFESVSTPTHGSWLNMVEGFFSKLTKQMLVGIRVSSKEQLEERIYQYFAENNEVPVPYPWSYKLDDIDRRILVRLCMRSLAIKRLKHAIRIKEHPNPARGINKLRKIKRSKT